MNVHFARKHNDHKIILDVFERTEIMQTMFSEHNESTLEFNSN